MGFDLAAGVSGDAPALPCDDAVGNYGPRLLIEIFFWNIMQRVSQLLVSFMIFMAVGEGVNKAVDVSVIQCFVAMGSNCVPIPGAMGVADYIMIDGFKQLVG